MTYQITEADIEAFTNGDCWALAREISKRTGWTVHAFGAYQEDAPQKLQNFDWVHVFVKTPDGHFLDVRGLSTEDDMITMYEDHVYGRYDWEPEYFDFPEISSKKDWKDLAILHRIFPKAPVAKVAASLIRAYHASELPIPVC